MLWTLLTGKRMAEDKEGKTNFSTRIQEILAAKENVPMRASLEELVSNPVPIPTQQQTNFYKLIELFDCREQCRHAFLNAFLSELGVALPKAAVLESVGEKGSLFYVYMRSFTDANGRMHELIPPKKMEDLKKAVAHFPAGSISMRSDEREPYFIIAPLKLGNGKLREIGGLYLKINELEHLYEIRKKNIRAFFKEIGNAFNCEFDDFPMLGFATTESPLGGIKVLQNFTVPADAKHKAEALQSTIAHSSFPKGSINIICENGRLDLCVDTGLLKNDYLSQLARECSVQTDSINESIPEIQEIISQLKVSYKALWRNESSRIR